MNTMKTTLPALCLSLLGAVLAPTARADEWDKKTVVTFNQLVEVPGVVLSAGTYVFKLADSDSDRHIVQIFNKDENHLYATILAIPDDRLEPTGKTVITFEERKAGSPEAIKAWFYPGDETGQEFVYPKVRAVELAKSTKEHVLAMPSEMANHMTKPANTMKEPHVAEMKRAPVTAITPQQQEVQLAQVHPPKPPEQPQTVAANKPVQHATKRSKHLPKTGSDLPLLALLGMLSLGAGAGLRVLSKRVV